MFKLRYYIDFDADSQDDPEETKARDGSDYPADMPHEMPELQIVEETPEKDLDDERLRIWGILGGKNDSVWEDPKNKKRNNLPN